MATQKIRTNINITGTLTAAGASTLAAISGTTLSLSGAATLASVTVGGTLGVTGATTLTGGVTGGLTVTGNAIFNNNLNVTGSFTASGGVSYSGGSNFMDNAFSIEDNVDATKKIYFDAGAAATTGTSTTIYSSQTVNRLVTLPDASVTLVGTSDTATITNKTIDADLNTITNIENADIKAAAGIERSKIAAGSVGHVMINNGVGAMSSEAQLSNARGGFATDTSLFTGVVKATTGTFSASALVDADVDPSAAIDRAKIANGTANHVVINTAGGALSSEASLAETRGGTAQTSYATGDVLYASGVNTLSKLAAGAPGKVLKVSSANIPAWEDGLDPARELNIVDDFYGMSPWSLGWSGHSGGAGAGASTSSASVVAGHPGVVNYITGSTATGRGGMGLSVSLASMFNGHILSADPITLEWIIQVPTLSTGAEEFTVSAGAYKNSTSDTQPEGTWFYYDRAGIGVNWQCRTAAASTVTTTDSGVAVSTNWVRLTIVATDSSVAFYIDGTLVATNATNIPTLSVTPAIKIQKTVGTTNTGIAVDAFRLYQKFSTPR